MGDHYVSVPHYCVLMEENGASVLFTGDTAVGGKDLAEFCSGKDIDVALMPFPWAMLRGGRRSVQEVIEPEHLVILHLPLEEDDTEGYRRATEKCIAKLSPDIDIRIMDEFLQEEIIYYD